MGPDNPRYDARMSQPDPSSSSATERRAPTAAEAKALAHPLRLRILFACRDRARSNKELAAGLGSTPGTIHYHLKPLVAEGFLAPAEARSGPRGSTEQPYRSTGKSWQLAGDPDSSRTLRDVAAWDLLAAADDDVVTLTRLGMTLAEPERLELVARLHALAEEFKARGTATDQEADATEDLTLLIAVHRSAMRTTEGR